jgi:hypothetical protein
MLYSLDGIRSRLGELHLALGIIPVAAETEPTGEAGLSKPAKPFADPLSKISCQSRCQPCLCVKDDGESDGSMSEGEIRDSTGCWSHNGLGQGLRLLCPAKV